MSTTKLAGKTIVAYVGPLTKTSDEENAIALPSGEPEALARLRSKVNDTQPGTVQDTPSVMESTRYFPGPQVSSPSTQVKVIPAPDASVDTTTAPTARVRLAVLSTNEGPRGEAVAVCEEDIESD